MSVQRRGRVGMFLTAAARFEAAGRVLMKRRELIALLACGAAAPSVAWPLAARAQQSPVPVIGFMDIRSADAIAERLRGFRQGLREIGFSEGETVAIEYRWGENKSERMPELAADLVRRHVAVILAGGSTGAVLA